MSERHREDCVSWSALKYTNRNPRKLFALDGGTLHCQSHRTEDGRQISEEVLPCAIWSTTECLPIFLILRCSLFLGIEV